MIIYIDSAQVSLDICVYTISNTKLGEAVLRKYKEGIKIRIITDASMSFEIGSQIPLFMKNGKMFIFLCTVNSSLYHTNIVFEISNF